MVCDEAVSALDVSVQAAVLNLLRDLRRDFGIAYLFISHDIGVIAHIADRIAVMYRGGIVEEGPAAAVLDPPWHPYTEALLSAVPVIGDRGRAASRIRLAGDPGDAPASAGCRFAARCPRKVGRVCDEQSPPWQQAERRIGLPAISRPRSFARCRAAHRRRGWRERPAAARNRLQLQCAGLAQAGSVCCARSVVPGDSRTSRVLRVGSSVDKYTLSVIIPTRSA